MSTLSKPSIHGEAATFDYPTSVAESHGPALLYSRRKNLFERAGVNLETRSRSGQHHYAVNEKNFPVRGSALLAKARIPCLEFLKSIHPMDLIKIGLSVCALGYALKQNLVPSVIDCDSNGLRFLAVAKRKSQTPTPYHWPPEAA